jgi:hypothetical protein
VGPGVNTALALAIVEDLTGSTVMAVLTKSIVFGYYRGGISLGVGNLLANVVGGAPWSALRADAQHVARCDSARRSRRGLLSAVWGPLRSMGPLSCTTCVAMGLALCSFTAQEPIDSRSDRCSMPFRPGMRWSPTTAEGSVRHEGRLPAEWISTPRTLLRSCSTLAGGPPPS